MAIFAIITQPNPNNVKLPDAIKEHFGNANYALEGGHWLISANRTAKEISDILGITDGSGGGGLILEVASYFGRANPNIWTWIKLHWESGRNP